MVEFFGDVAVKYTLVDYLCGEVTIGFGLN